jgi:hypothetical protein
MWQAVTVIEAQEQLKMFNVLDWPNMKNEKRKKAHKDLFKLAYPSEIKTKNSVSPQDLQRLLGR